MRDLELRRVAGCSVALVGLALSGCAPAGPTATPQPRVAIDVAALSLAGVRDVVWDLEVVNGAVPPQSVWQRRITSSGYGDGAGSASYVGPCDADPAVRNNTVRVWVVGIYDAPIAAADAGAFNAGSTAGVGAVAASPLGFENPTAAAPLTRTVPCVEGADATVSFDVALMRPASQGFFDVAVAFNDIFCSAKLDCCRDTGGDGCDPLGTEDIDLLFDASGARGRTMVLGFACTGGVDSGAATTLYMDALTLDCTPGGADFAPDISISPNATATGNQCAAVASAMSGCAAVSEANGVDADSYLFQVAVYRGDELLETAAGSAHKSYWNVALGVTGLISSCVLHTRATADDSNDAGVGVTGGAVAAGTVYPYVIWAADLGACGSEALTFGNPSAAVRTGYTTTDGAGVTFAFSYAGTAPPTGPACTAGAQVFNFTGADQAFVVPEGCTQLTAKLWGAGGGACANAGYSAAGGGGGFATGALAVTPGASLTLVVGGGGCGYGRNLSYQIVASNGCTFYGGGGQGGPNAARGGGASWLADGAAVLVVAAGGGGGGGGNTSGGAGGGLVGENGAGGFAGGGGTQVAGGGGGYPLYVGGYLHGGGNTGGSIGGGGGSGWYGGGGGGGATVEGGGGGGSSYIALASAASTMAGSGATAGGASDPERNAGVPFYTNAIGDGGIPNEAFISGVGPVAKYAGGHGRVILTWQ